VTAQADLLNNQIVAMQHQYQNLLDRFSDLSHHHGLVVQEVLTLKKTVVNQGNIMNQVMIFLNGVNSNLHHQKGVNPPTAVKVDTTASPFSHIDPNQDDGSEPSLSSPLHHAQRLMSDFSAETLMNNNALEQMQDLYRRISGSSTPPPDITASVPTVPPTSHSHTHTPNLPAQNALSSVAHARMTADISDMIYPIGAIPANGIDPMVGDHAIPYSIPTPDAGRTRTHAFDPWIRSPHILLVEDDPTCRKIGAKFLQTFDCQTDCAFNGMEAVQKMTAGKGYDLVLMDIIMPQLDGVSAAHLIRAFDNTPIIAMTANIRQDDVNLYFTHGKF
jgi:osomolarity two-component system response regulator SKN7